MLELIEQWGAANSNFLKRVFLEFDQALDWPDRETLQRKVIQEGGSLGVSHLAYDMPRELGEVEGSTGKIVLFPLALQYVPAARPVLEGFVAVARLAEERLRQNVPLKISRQDLTEHLGLDEHLAALVSRVLLRNAPFLGSGSSEPDTWEREIFIDGLMPYLGAETPEDYLRIYVERTLKAQRPIPLSALLHGQNQARREADRRTTEIGIAAGVVGVGAALIGMVLTLPWVYSGLVSRRRARADSLARLTRAVAAEGPGRHPRGSPDRALFRRRRRGRASA